MNNFPENFTANNITDDYKKSELFSYYMSKIRHSIYLFILENDLTKDFYDLDTILRQYNIKDKQVYHDSLITELKERGFIIHKIFGDTGLIIARNEDELKNNTWGNSIDTNIN